MKEEKKKNILMLSLFIIIIILIILVIIISNKKANNLNIKDTYLNELTLKEEIGSYINSDMLSSEIISLTYETKEITLLGTNNKIIDGSISLNNKITKTIDDDKIVGLTGISYQSSADIILFLLTEKKNLYYLKYKTYEEINSDNLIHKIDIDNIDRLILVNLEETYTSDNEMYQKGDKITKELVFAEKNMKIINLLDYITLE